MRIARGSPITSWRSTIPSSKRILWAAAGVLALMMAFGCSRSTPEKNAGVAGKVGTPAGDGSIGSQAPDFALADLSGKTVHLSDFKGKVVIVDFWATWCGPCRVEIPDFVKLQNKYKEKGLEIVGLSLDADGEKAVKPFVEKHEINYTMLLGNDDTAKSYGGILGIPTTFVIDRQGRIVQKFVGVMPAKTFEDTIRPLLES